MTFKYKISGALTLLTLLFTISACDDFLNEQPFSQVGDEQFWQTNGDAASGIAAAYDAMQSTYRLKHYLWGEFRSDNHIASDRVSGNYNELVTNSLTPGNGNPLRWNDLYTMIGRANLAIERIPNITAFDQTLLGEAHAIRAYGYFDAVRVWGDVPLFTESINSLDQELTRARTDANTILNDVVIPDMLKAEQLIAAPSREFRFSKASVYALQAHVYMWVDDYPKAKEALDKLIALNEYELVTSQDSWSKLFLNDLNLGTFQTGPELIFSIRYDALEDGRRASGNYELFFAGVPNFFISPQAELKWLERFPTDTLAWRALYPDFDPPQVIVGADTLFGDYRYYETREDRAIGEARVAKYTKINFSPNDDATNIPVYRYSGILLLKALVENELDNADEALRLVNLVRAARELPEVTDDMFGDDKDSRENYILDERQFELFAEGDRWWDLRVTDKVQVALDTITQISDECLLFPIFEEHIVDNDNLTQNGCYE